MGFHNIGPEDFEALIGQEGYVLLDVRAPEEYAEGQIEGHTMINFFDPGFPDELAELDKSKNYLVYCRSGNRSGQACGLMEELGFEGELYNLNGGIRAWNAYKSN
jgi:rhodanese-related sulfurtransferase